MKTLYEAATVTEVKQRIARLKPDSERQWGKMTAQAVAHCSAGMQNGDRRDSRSTRVRWSTFWRSGETVPDRQWQAHGSQCPTDPRLVVKDDRDLVVESRRWESSSTASRRVDLRPVPPILTLSSAPDARRMGPIDVPYTSTITCASSRLVRRYCGLGSNRMGPGRLILQRQRANTLHELREKLVGAHEDREVPAALDGHERLLRGMNHSEILPRQCRRRREILGALKEEDRNGELEPENLPVDGSATGARAGPRLGSRRRRTERNPAPTRRAPPA